MRASEILEGHVQRIEKSGRSRGARLFDGALQQGLVVGERLQDADLAVEVDDAGEVAGLETLNESNHGRLGERELAVHAGTRVEQQRERKGNPFG